MTKPIELSVIIPAYNEALRLPPTLQETHDFLTREGISFEILIVDDGSSDGTSSTVTSSTVFDPSTLRVIRYTPNRGKGYAVRTGVREAKGQYVLFCDADGSTPISEYLRLRDALDDTIEIAIGSRALYSEETEVYALWYRKFLGRLFNRIVNVLAVPKVQDTQCGFKLFTQRSAKFLFGLQQSDRFGFDVEILYLAWRVGIPVAEVAVNWCNVPGSKVNLVKDSAKMFLELLTYRFRHMHVNEALYRAYCQE